MRPLYLEGSADLWIRLDGPALAAMGPGRPLRWCPVSRISRLAVIGSVRWDAEALKVCLASHRPVAFLDRKCRFFRIRYQAPRPLYGVARHIGELFRVPRFARRYRAWWHSGVAASSGKCLREVEIQPRFRDAERRWQQLCRDQSRRWGLPVARYYQLLLGLCAAQTASELVQLGVPRNLGCWMRTEWTWFVDFLQLERWHLALLLNDLLASGRDVIERRDLIGAFESTAAERSRRLDVWRRGTFLAMAGVAPPWGTEPRPEAVFHTKDQRVREALFWYFRGTESRMRTWTAYRRESGAGHMWTTRMS